MYIFYKYVCTFGLKYALYFFTQISIEQIQSDTSVERDLDFQYIANNC